MARKRKKKPFSLKSLKRKFKNKLKKTLNLKFFAILFLVLVVFLAYLSISVFSRFEARRWNLPSRIYSDSFSLFVGKTATVSEIDEKLTHLNYRNVTSTPTHPGEYQKSGSSYQVYLHDFDYPHEKFKGHVTSFTINGNRVANLNVEGRAQTLVNLEPELIASIFDENMEDRTVVTLDQVPKTLTQAVIAIEDERFYHHIGVDPIGILRAMFANLRAMSVVQGGSTLTQQLVKNFFLHQRKTLGRKFNEFFMALIMELRYSKNEILEAYLNEIYFGQRGAASISGVEEASQFYFSKHVGQLTLAESALLAGMIKSPGAYSPFNHPDKALQRRNIVLKKMLEDEYITQADYDKAIRSDLPKVAQKRSTTAPYFVEFVKKQLSENFPVDVLSSQGLRIFTTLEMNWQRAAEASVTNWLNQLERDFAKLKKSAQGGKPLQGALIAVQPGTGFIKAYVGGREFGKVQFDHLSQAERQPGSTFKPFVYLTALDSRGGAHRRFTPASILKDEPLTLSNSGQTYKPRNYDNHFHGEVRLRTALENSFNVATVWLGEQIGFDSVIRTARKAGITSDLQPYPSMALGAFEVKPLELAMAYTVFPNQGTKTEPISIRRVVTAEGEVLEKKSVALEPVFSSDSIYLMNRILKGVVDNGTAASARSRGLSVLAAGKTGTTSSTRDAWFVGYTPELLALSWVGYDDNSETGLTGASGALPIWTEFMKKATTGAAYSDFTPTQNIIIVTIDKSTGLLYDSSCSAPVAEYFIEGTQPYEYCNEVLHNEAFDEDDDADDQPKEVDPWEE